MQRISLIVMMTFLLNGCSVFGTSEQTQADQIATDDFTQSVQSVSLGQSSINKGQSGNSQSFDLSFSKKDYDGWINFYVKRDRERFARHMQNADQYRETVLSILNKYELPVEIFYVGLIESGYNTKVRSHASAVGPWQFVKGTSIRYGLRTDGYVDERTNLYKSTEAAASYFRDLYNIFGSWDLALCAYNKGEYGIINAIRKGNTRNYFELVQKKLIPQETVHYLPKLAAAMEIYNNRSKYGFDERSEFGALYKNYYTVLEKSSFSITEVAKKYAVTVEDIRRLNPDLLSANIRVRSSDPLTLVLPDTSVVRVVAEKEQNHVEKVFDKKSEKIHKVRSGESLYFIALSYNVTIRAIKNANHLSRSQLIVGQRLKIPNFKSMRKPNVRKTYIVKKGDNLRAIAQVHKTTITKLVDINNLKTRVIYPKQKLYVK